MFSVLLQSDRFAPIIELTRRRALVWLGCLCHLIFHTMTNIASH